MVKKLFAVSAVSAGLMLGGLAAPAMASDAPATKVALQVSVGDVPLKTGGPTSFTVTAKLSRPLTSSEVGVVVVGARDAKSLDDLKHVTLKGSGTTRTATFHVSRHAETGRWVAAVVVVDRKTGRTSEKIGRFDVQLPTHETLNASPEPAAHGGKITVAGRLTHYNPADKAYTSYAHKTVEVYFNPAGAAPKTFVGTVTTNAKGEYSKKFTAKTTGTWSSTFGGSTKFGAAASNKDHVVVK